MGFVWLLSWREFLCALPFAKPSCYGKLETVFVEIHFDDDSAIVDWCTDMEVARQVVERSDWARVWYC
jgi:hypothetical protein